MADYSLDDLAAFREYDDALALEGDGLPPSPEHRNNRECRNCGGCEIVYSNANAGSGHAGAAVCSACGAVLDDIVIFERMRGCVLSRRHSNYRRIHHRSGGRTNSNSQVFNWFWEPPSELRVPGLARI
eukprot:scaffold17291_cov127-Isochrysis_galbana.AAC.4